MLLNGILKLCEAFMTLPLYTDKGIEPRESGHAQGHMETEWQTQS